MHNTIDVIEKCYLTYIKLQFNNIEKVTCINEYLAYVKIQQNYIYIKKIIQEKCGPITIYW